MNQKSITIKIIAPKDNHLLASSIQNIEIDIHLILILFPFFFKRFLNFELVHAISDGLEEIKYKSERGGGEFKQNIPEKSDTFPTNQSWLLMELRTSNQLTRIFDVAGEGGW